MLTFGYIIFATIIVSLISLIGIFFIGLKANKLEKIIEHSSGGLSLNDAISFPPVEYVRELIRKEKILARAMEELRERKEELKV